MLASQNETAIELDSVVSSNEISLDFDLAMSNMEKIDLIMANTQDPINEFERFTAYTIAITLGHYQAIINSSIQAESKIKPDIIKIIFNCRGLDGKITVEPRKNQILSLCCGDFRKNNLKFISPGDHLKNLNDNTLHNHLSHFFLNCFYGETANN